MVVSDFLREAYQGKKVFVTGHTGFKGSWLIQMLNILGAKVCGYALEPETSYDLYSQINGDSLCDSVIADIRNIQELNNRILAFEPDYVFHLAAQPLVRLSYELPHYTWEVNVMGSINVLESLRNLDKKCSAVFITTDKVYENLETDKAYEESDKLGGFDPYSSSKAAAEIAINSYRSSFFHPNHIPKHQKSIASGRAGNVIGGGDFAKDRLLPDLAKARLKGNDFVVRNPDSVRPWQHVLEPLTGYLQLAALMYQNPGKFEGAYNFGPETEDVLTVKELADYAIEVWGSGGYQIIGEEHAVHEAKLLRLNIEKAKNNLFWKPKFDSRMAVEKSILWYKNSEEKAEIKCRTQIEEYFSL